MPAVVTIPETLFLRHMENIARQVGQAHAARIAQQNMQQQHGYDLQDQATKTMQEELSKNEEQTREFTEKRRQERLELARARGHADALNDTTSDQEINDPDEEAHYQLGKSLGAVQRKVLESQLNEKTFLAKMGVGGRQEIESSKEAAAKEREDAMLKEQTRVHNLEHQDRQAAIRAKPGGAAPLPESPVNLNASGRDEAFLSSLPTAEQLSIKSIANGKDPMPAMTTKGGAPNPLAQKVIRYEPGFNATLWKTRNNVANAESPNGNVGMSMAAFGRAMNHARHLSETIKQLGNSDFPSENAAKNFWAKNIKGGDRAPILKDYDETAYFLGKETEKTLAGSNAGSVEAQKALADINDRSAPQGTQLTAVKKLAELLKAQADEFKGQHDNAYQGVGEPFGLVRPETASTLDYFGIPHQYGQSQSAVGSSAPQASEDPRKAKFRQLIQRGMSPDEAAKAIQSGQ